MQNKKRILLAYPQMGMSGSYVRHIPLSLLYAAIGSISAGFAVDIVDTRLNPTGWREELKATITPDTVLLGVSVITGTPVGSALEITSWSKQNYPHIPTVWGGPHANFNSGEILSEKSVDYAICGYGSMPLALLAKNLRGDAEAPPLKSIKGLIFRNSDTGNVETVPPENSFEMVNYREIPYHLIEKEMPRYGQFDSGERIFSIYSSMGCPYNCAFCSSPALYRDFGRKYELVSPQDVADHIEYVHREYGASYIYFIDDDSFVNPDHLEAIIDEIDRRSLQVKLGFRGARIDEVLRMDDAYLVKLARAGTNILHIGAESGSQRMLDLMRKNISVDDILEVNRKLARHPEITAGYNWMIGFPSETIEDLRSTQKLIMQIIKENPNAFIFPPNKYRPLPGTELYETSLRFGYKPPETQMGWIDVEVEGDYKFPWYTTDFANMVNMMHVTSYFLDKKLFSLAAGRSFKHFLIRAIGRLYRPFARIRYRYGIASCLFEYWIYNMLVRNFRRWS
ncbi:MAG: radical SAM protein [Desulfuromonadaceae bacterium]|nr:radical SAM protein [Desulfuromonadaceae bacterium]